MPTHITVEYPTMLDVVIKTEAEAKAMGYKKAIVKHVPVNRTHHITIRKTARSIQEMYMNTQDWEAEQEAMCKEQTGLSRAAYQLKHKRSWNE